jgi:hypothetical protein
MAQAQILPPLYRPEAAEDDGSQKPAVKMDGSPETPREMMPPVAQARIDSEESIDDQRHAANDGVIAARERLQVTKQDAAAVVGFLNAANSTATPQEKAKGQKELDKVTAKIAAFNAKTKDRLPPSMFPALRNFLRISTRISNGRGYADACTTDTLLPGKDMTKTAAAIAGDIFEGRDTLKWIAQIAPDPAEVTAMIARDFERRAGLADMRMRAAAGVYHKGTKHGFFVPGGGRHLNGDYETSGYEPPVFSCANGLGQIYHVEDGLATVAAAYGDDLVNRIAAKALERYEGQETITMAERRAKREETEARLLELERLHAFWVYAAREEGIRIDHVSTNPFALLDIVIRK